MTSKFFVQCIIKQLLDSVLVISRIIKVSVRVISLSLRLRLITLTSTLIILDITKTSSNNCLEFVSLTVADKANPHLHKSTSCLKVKQQVRFTHFQTSEAEAVAAILLTTAHC